VPLYFPLSKDITEEEQILLMHALRLVSLAVEVALSPLLSEKVTLKSPLLIGSK
jgi:hypothetical protein